MCMINMVKLHARLKEINGFHKVQDHIDIHFQNKNLLVNNRTGTVRSVFPFFHLAFDGVL